MSDITNEVGAQFRFCVSGDFSPADAGTDYTVGTPTDVLLTHSGLGDDAGRQSDKVDLGANRPPWFSVDAAADLTGETPVANERIDYYWAPSNSGTQGTGNVAGNSGADGAAPDGALGSITLNEFLEQCIYIGPLIVHDGAVVQNGHIGVFQPPTRYGQMIVVDRAGDALEADNVESAVWMTGILKDVA